MSVMFPSAAGTANAAFNPARWYAEAGQTAQEIPGSSTPRGSFQTAMRNVYLPVLVVIVLLWALERRRLKAFAR